MKWLIVILLGALVLVACNEQSAVSQPEQVFKTIEVNSGDTHEPTTSMLVFEIVEERPDLFLKWRDYNEIEMQLDRWDAFVDEDDDNDDFDFLIKERVKRDQKKTVPTSALKESCNYLPCSG
jgi:hypothetical protein